MDSSVSLKDEIWFLRVPSHFNWPLPSTQCACAILSSVACPALQYFSTLSHKRHTIFGEKKDVEHKMYWFLYNFGLKHCICFSLLVPSQNREKQLLTWSCLSVRIEQLGFHWTDFHKIWYANIFRKSVEKFQVSLKCDKNNGTFFLSHLAHFSLEWEIRPVENEFDADRHDEATGRFSQFCERA
jgi:hypothetical protein